MERMSYIAKAGTVLSQAANALVFNGHPDMSLSTRAYLEREQSEWWWAVYSWAEALFGAGHCEGSWEADCRYADNIKQIQNAQISNP